MDCILMHKSIPVLNIVIDEATSSIIRINEVINPLHLPIGVNFNKGNVDRAFLNEWWKGRSIPASRMGINKALEELNVSNTQKLLEKSYGLSLSDQYWICPKGSNLRWENINFFNNSFSEDVGNILLGKGTDSKSISLISPDNTSDGWLKKKWQIIDGKRYLIKGGSGAIRQEPYNEVFASRVMERLDIPHVSYSLSMIDDYPYSICEDFITKDTELISAWYIMQTQKKPNDVSIYEHFISCTERLGIPYVSDFLDKMLTLDYLIVNEDRHQNNFGAVRDADTLAWQNMAPIYDSGTSLWFDTPTSMISAKYIQMSKPFKTSHAEQLKLVKSFNWLDYTKLKNIDEEFREIIKDSVFIDDTRRDKLCYAIKGRVEMLSEAVMQHENTFYLDSISNEVVEDIAYSGKGEDDELEI